MVTPLSLSFCSSSSVTHYLWASTHPFTLWECAPFFHKDVCTWIQRVHIAPWFLDPDQSELNLKFENFLPTVNISLLVHCSGSAPGNVTGWGERCPGSYLIPEWHMADWDQNNHRISLGLLHLYSNHFIPRTSLQPAPRRTTSSGQSLLKK